jgi:hypothetical protein
MSTSKKVGGRKTNRESKEAHEAPKSVANQQQTQKENQQEYPKEYQKETVEDGNVDGGNAHGVEKDGENTNDLSKETDGMNQQDSTRDTVGLKRNQGSVDNENEDGDEEDDEDFDPNAKDEADNSESEKEDEVIPDYKSIEATTTQVRTRNQRYKDKLAAQSEDLGLVKPTHTTVDIDLIFSNLKSSKTVKDEWIKNLDDTQPSNAIKPPIPNNKIVTPHNELDPQMITIKSSFTFAGKVFTETKQVDANSAEAQAYLNSTICLTDDALDTKRRSFIPVLRKLPGTNENIELKIKLKRPSLIDKFLNSNKKQKLSTLEKSRLDWAGFVDKRKLKDELKIHNKAGYLDKQDFLGRLQAKRDENYQTVKEQERLKKQNS